MFKYKIETQGKSLILHFSFILPFGYKVNLYIKSKNSTESRNSYMYMYIYNKRSVSIAEPKQMLKRVKSSKQKYMMLIQIHTPNWMSISHRTAEKSPEN